MGVRSPGRPSAYTPEVATEICERLSAGETLSQICKDEHIPPKNTVVGWAMENRDGFSERYAQARAAMLEHWAEEIVTISDDGVNDWTDREYGKGRIERVVDNECVQRSRLRVDTRKWLLSKLRPQTYGDRVAVEHEDPNAAELIRLKETLGAVLKELPAEQRIAIARRLFADKAVEIEPPPPNGNGHA